MEARIEYLLGSFCRYIFIHPNTIPPSMFFMPREKKGGYFGLTRRFSPPTFVIESPPTFVKMGGYFGLTRRFSPPTQ